jgi:hypothetical protein
LVGRTAAVITLVALTYLVVAPGALESDSRPVHSRSIGALGICSACSVDARELAGYRYVILNSWDAR